jgi:hypothetical protein
VICGTHSGSVPPGTSGFLSRNHSTSAPYLFFNRSPIVYNLNQFTFYLYDREVGFFLLQKLLAVHVSQP